MSTTSNYFGGFLMGLCTLTLGFSGGVQLGQYLSQPTAVYEKKIEGDNREFLVVDESRNLIRVPFVRPAGSDGPFLRLDSIAQDESVDSQDKNKQLIDKLKLK